MFSFEGANVDFVNIGKLTKHLERFAARVVITGDDSKEDPPVPIPNTVVKLFRVDDTWRVTAWESRSLPVPR